MRCLFRYGAAHTHTHTHTYLRMVCDVRNIAWAHQISLKCFCSVTTSHDFIYLYIKAFPEQAAWIFEVFFVVRFVLVESPITSKEGCVRLIMSKVSRTVAIALSFLIFVPDCWNLLSWPYSAQSFIFHRAVFIRQWCFPKDSVYVLLCFYDESVSTYSHNLLTL
jgi:hypothetical protein